MLCCTCGAQVAYTASNGGLPSGRSRSPGFDVVENKSAEAGSGASGNAGAGNAASVFLAGATVVTGAPATSSSSAAGGGRAVGRGGGWTGLGSAAEDVLRSKDVDHAFAGAMLQRSSSAPPVSDHVRLFFI